MRIPEEALRAIERQRAEERRLADRERREDRARARRRAEHRRARRAALPAAERVLRWAAELGATGAR